MPKGIYERKVLGPRKKEPPLIEYHVLAAAASVVTRCPPEVLFDSRKFLASAARVGTYLTARDCGMTLYDITINFDISNGVIHSLIRRAETDINEGTPRGNFIETVRREVMLWAYLCTYDQLEAMIPKHWPASYDPDVRRWTLGELNWNKETSELRAYEYHHITEHSTDIRPRSGDGAMRLRLIGSGRTSGGLGGGG